MLPLPRRAMGERKAEAAMERKVSGGFALVWEPRIRKKLKRSENAAWKG